MLRGESSMAQISRDPLDLVRRRSALITSIPTASCCSSGTMFAPTEDRGAPGGGFTHKLGDVVTISSPMLGSLVNTVNHCDRIAPWTFGLQAFFSNLAVRGLLPT